MNGGRRPGRRAWASRPLQLVLGVLPVALMTVLATGSYAVPATWHVDAGSCQPGGTGSDVDPFCNIQDAICMATSGDLVSVASGTYAESIFMKPGVDVVSVAGPIDTIIDGAGQPCTLSDFCNKATDPQCSVVIFSVGHTPDTLLDGFTITGGQGRLDGDQVIGGGISILSSPTITNSIITNNVLAGPSPLNRNLSGAGVYIGIGRPVITNTTISNNLAIPPDGSNGNYTSAYGGGIWSNIEAAPTITDSIIQGNVAGDPNYENSINAGGGIVVFGPADPNTPVILYRNVITDNVAGDYGGGIAAVGFPLSVAPIRITNSIIAGNLAFQGGGVYTYRQYTTVNNNTIVDNTTGFFGGGIFAGRQKPPFPVEVSNDIVQGNHILSFPGGSGGGIFSLNVELEDNLSVVHNDVFGNQGGQCRGDLMDTDCNGIDGNISADALFVDEPNRDFTLSMGSPVIDAADALLAPIDDYLGVIRGIDGDGVIDSPVAGDVDMGALESVTVCALNVEVCDGSDNNCDGVVDEGFSDADGDGDADCIDPDDDNDGVADAADCAPFDDTAFSPPVEVTNVSLDGGGPTEISFDEQNLGSSTEYEILSGVAGRLFTGGLQEMFCVAGPLGGSPWFDDRDTPLGDAWYFQVRSSSSCGTGTLGTLGRDAPGAGDACALGVVDADIDGSASDFDCDDTDPARSPFLTEICDGIDNDCSLIVDDGFGQSTCGVGECEVTVENCSGGMTQTCVPGAPVAEVCDSLDNDCNGVDDDGIPPITCGLGECAVSVSGCVDGEEPVCVPGAPVAETCDTLDNDCNGVADDLGQITCGVGACEASVEACVDGEEQVCVPGAPVAEVCDGLDNDCNGVTDDGFADFDLDGQADCVDPDDDNDGALDVDDCAPFDDTAFGMPMEVAGVTVTLSPTTTEISWTEQNIGSSTLYGIVAGSLSITGQVDFSGGSCLATSPMSPAEDPQGDPSIGEARYFLVTSSSVCGTATLGSAARDMSPTCP